MSLTLIRQDITKMAVDAVLVRRNWLLGRRIVQEELKGEDRAKYGAEVIKRLSVELTARYGKGFTKTNLYTFLTMADGCAVIAIMVVGLRVTGVGSRLGFRERESNEKRK